MNSVKSQMEQILGIGESMKLRLDYNSYAI